MLEDARAHAKAMLPMGVWALRAFEIRKRTLENRITAGERLVGVKFGGALLKGNNDEKRYEGIFGFLTDAMQIKEELKLSEKDTKQPKLNETKDLFEFGVDYYA